jgi:hypothetical protein
LFSREIVIARAFLRKYLPYFLKGIASIIAVGVVAFLFIVVLLPMGEDLDSTDMNSLGILFFYSSLAIVILTILGIAGIWLHPMVGGLWFFGLGLFLSLFILIDLIIVEIIITPILINVLCGALSLAAWQIEKGKSRSLEETQIT